jgi:hypothetical protein
MLHTLTPKWEFGMSASKVSNWLQIAANIGIIGGLILVGIQIKQNTDLTSVNLRALAVQQETDRWLAEMGENPSDVIVNAVLKPEELTPGEIRVLMASVLWYQSMFTRNQSLEHAGIFDASWRRRLPQAAFDIASNPVTRAFLLDMEANEDWQKELREQVEALPPDFGFEAYQSLLNIARSQRAGTPP